MLPAIQAILQGALAIGFGFLVNSKFFVDFVIKINGTILPFGSRPGYISFLRTYIKIAKFFFLIGGAGLLIFGVINFFLN